MRKGVASEKVAVIFIGLSPFVDQAQPQATGSRGSRLL